MKKLLAVTTFAAFALAAQSAAACDWNREANSQEQTVATTATPSEQTQAAQEAAPAQAPTTNVAADSREPVTPSAPVVLVNDKH
jgi:spermidine/putrescine-binding protein